MHARHVRIIMCRPFSLISPTNTCMWYIYDARSLRGGLVFMQAVRVTESGVASGYILALRGCLVF